MALAKEHKVKLVLKDKEYVDLVDRARRSNLSLNDLINQIIKSQLQTVETRPN
jgi:hypothetical protein